uniref:Uncharacterized protein n=1 Tax=Setaria viridis TaxID=4556 RepID=A0A4U6VQJ8_SETVI|nr:hypothetical protein SEVIR_3G219950v2 [Setaria viridis]
MHGATLSAQLNLAREPKNHMIIKTTKITASSPPKQGPTGPAGRNYYSRKGSCMFPYA